MLLPARCYVLFRYLAHVANSTYFTLKNFKTLLTSSMPPVCVGTLPADLARVPSLAFLDLSHNQLTGSLNDFGAALTESNNLLQVCFVTVAVTVTLFRPEP
jgi:hypothetical protein